MPLPLADAQKLISGAHSKAHALGISVTDAVVDEGGLLIALSRMDGAPPLSPQVAEAKAVGAAMLHRDGASFADLAKDRPGFFAVADRLVRVPIVAALRPHPPRWTRAGRARRERRAPRTRPRVRGGGPQLNLRLRRGSYTEPPRPRWL